MKQEMYYLGHELTTEGEQLKHLYIIGNGNFEVTKSLYYKTIPDKANKVIDSSSVRIFQYFVSENEIINELFSDLKSLISSTITSKDEFKNLIKGYKRKESRISSIGEYEIVGLIELIIDCPFAISTTRCISKDAIVYSFSREDMMNRITISPFLMHTIRQKLILLSERIDTALESLINTKRTELNVSTNSMKNNLSSGINKDMSPK